MRRALLLIAVLIALGAGALAARAYEDWQSLQRPIVVRVQDTTRIRGWMTVRFIANAHGVPVDALAARLGAPPRGNITLNELARARGVSPREEEDAARAAVAELRGAPPPAAGASP
jgi:hypothetical protein